MDKNLNLPKKVWLLSWISFFTDIASEMLYPIMPLYLNSIGFSSVTIGVLEGLAEAIAGISKMYFGRWSDLLGKRSLFVQFGYLMSSISKPLLAISSSMSWVFSCRTMDRLGKGIRTGARDALLAEEASPQNKGKVFGLHRSMDTAGAVVGPLLALSYLYFIDNNYQRIFWLTLIPGLMVVLLTRLVKDRPNSFSQLETKKPSLSECFRYFSNLPHKLKKLFGIFAVLSLVNSSDMFLLLKIKHNGFNDHEVVAFYIFYNCIYALFSYSFGNLSDKFGRKRIYLIGLIFFALAYLGMGLFTNLIALVICFLLYGLFSAATEGITKAWISDLVGHDQLGVALGAHASLMSLGVLFANIFGGVLWYVVGPNWTFLFAGGVTFTLVFYLIFEKEFN